MNGHLRSLDALRGLAALTVVLHHCLITQPAFYAPYLGKPTDGDVQVLAFSPLHILWGGFEAVMVFFVLSGFVLALPFWDGEPPGYGKFAVRRIFRIYPAYLVAVGVASLAMELVTRRAGGVSTALGALWHQDVQWRDVPMYLFMLDGTPRFLGADSVIWSLVHEMRVSLVFPGLIWLMRRLGYASVPAALALSFAAKTCQSRGWIPAGLASSLVYTLFLLWLFVLGAELARRLPDLRRIARRLPRAGQVAFIGLAALVLNARWEFPPHSALAAFLTYVGAGMLIAGCASLPIVIRGLERPVLLWLGKVSYSLYLIHVVVLLLLVNGLAGLVPLPWLQFATVPIALLCAAWLNRWVESPSSEWSRRLFSSTAASKLPATA